MEDISQGIDLVVYYAMKGLTYTVVFPMTTYFPQIGTVDVWWDDFCEATFPVLGAHQPDELVEDMRAGGKPETTARWEFVEEK